MGHKSLFSPPICHAALLSLGTMRSLTVNSEIRVFGPVADQERRNCILASCQGRPANSAARKSLKAITLASALRRDAASV